MEVVTKEFRVYDYEELSEESKESAYKRWYRDVEFGWNTEYRETLDEFCKVFCFSLRDWNVDSCGYNYRMISVSLNNYPGDCQLNDTRAMIRVSKFIIGQIHGKTDDCILTGFCADCAILDVYNSVKKWKMFFTSYDDFIRASLDAFFSEWSNDMEYSFSRECFEEAYASEEKYLESGKVFTC